MGDRVGNRTSPFLRVSLEKLRNSYGADLLLRFRRGRAQRIVEETSLFSLPTGTSAPLTEENQGFALLARELFRTYTGHLPLHSPRFPRHQFSHAR